MKDLITLEEAVKIAKERNSNVDTYKEYNDAYEFYIDDGQIREGGSDCGFIVEKSGGRILRWHQYFMDLNRNIVEVGEPKKISQ